MAFKVELSVDSQVYPVKDFYLAVLRETTPKGQPSSQPSWSLDVTIDAVSDTTITQWMIDPTKQVDGSLTIYKSDGEGKMKSIEFKKGNCSGMVDQFIPEFSETSCFIRILGAEINVGNVKLSPND
jgi:hypothetical protein